MKYIEMVKLVDLIELTHDLADLVKSSSNLAESTLKI